MEENSKIVSFEFFPPKTDSGKAKLISISKAFEEMSADYFSVTFGAGGSTKRGTLETCVELYNSTKTSIVPHISGIGSTKEDIKCMLDEYIELGFKKLMVLRGDLPSGFGSTGDFSYAIDLINFIKVDDKYIGIFDDKHAKNILEALEVNNKVKNIDKYCSEH